MSFLNRVFDSFDYIGGAIVYLIYRSRHRMAGNLTPLENISRLSPAVCRVLGQNPGPFTLQGTNSYLVGSGKKKILIDTSEPNIPKYTENLLIALENSEISCIIATHHHLDHVGGIPNVLCNCTLKKDIPIYKMKRSNGVIDENASQYHYVEDGHELNVEGASLKLIYTPGHTMDHLIVYFKEENSVFSGDCILGERTSVFEDLYTYMQSLEIIKKIEPFRIYPGHGPVIESPKEKIEEYITHRNRRENQILDCLKEIPEGATPATLARTIYPNLSLDVRIAAVGNITHHLKKLKKEEKVDEISSGVYKLKNNDKISKI